MSIYIVDASVGIKWYVQEVDTTFALRVTSKHHELHAPDFFLIETDNILCKRIRRGELAPMDVGEIRRLLRNIPMKIHAVPEFQDEAFDLAVRTRRSIYDCLYLALAVRLGGQMVTADRRFYDSLGKEPLGKYVAWVGDVGEPPT
jgi:predicted nucleic acid-binding protein